MEAINSASRLLRRVILESETFYAARPAVLPPLSFGRVNDGRPIASQALLFRLPIELVQEVVAYLDTADLRSLALVDRDCRQLARSRLFTGVVLDYTDGKWALLDKLSHHEARSRRDSGGATEGHSIGACIRRVTVAAQSIRVRDRYKALSSTDENTSKEESAMHDIACSYYGKYLPNIVEALRFSLPNLDELIWVDRIELPQYMLTAISSLPIRRLDLHGIQLSLDYEYQLPPPEQQRWALRSLDLGTMSYPRTDWRDRVVNKFCLAILEAAAPTLERLSWRDYQGTKLSFGTSAIRFPKLRTLLLDTYHMPDDVVLDTFFPPDVENRVLRSVSIKVSSPHAREFLARRGHIRGLESLRLDLDTFDCPPDARTTDAVFLSANPQLKSLTLNVRRPEQLTDTLLPLLPSEFKFLTTLVVYFTPRSSGHDLSRNPEPLVAISRLTTLTTLWIAGGKHYYWTSSVRAAIATLSPLRNLTRLALPRGPRASLPILRVKDKYRERIGHFVGLYVKAFKELRWVYLEGLVYRVVGNMIVFEGGFTYYSHERAWESPEWRLW